jgi:hypothetical protein
VGVSNNEGKKFLVGMVMDHNMSIGMGSSELSL